MNEDQLYQLLKDNGLADDVSFDEFSTNFKDTAYQSSVYDLLSANQMDDGIGKEEFLSLFGDIQPQIEPQIQPQTESLTEPSTEPKRSSFWQNAKTLYDFHPYSPKTRIDAAKQAVQRGNAMAQQSRQLDPYEFDDMISGKPSTKEIEKLAQINERMAQYGSSPEYQEFTESTNLKDAFKALGKDPVGVLMELSLESLSAMVAGGIDKMAGSAAAGAGAGSVVPGVGTAAGGALGAVVGMGQTSYTLEYSGSLIESMQEAGVDITDANSIKQFVEDDELWNKARNKAALKALPIAAFDMLSAGLAGQLTKKPAKSLAKKAAAVGVDMGLGGAGEAAGQLLSEGRITSPTSVLAEVLGEVGPAMVQTPIAEAYNNLVRSPEESIKTLAQDEDTGLAEFTAEVRFKVEQGEITDSEAEQLIEDFKNEKEAAIEQDALKDMSDRDKEAAKEEEMADILDEVSEEEQLAPPEEEPLEVESTVEEDVEALREPSTEGGSELFRQVMSEVPEESKRRAASALDRMDEAAQEDFGTPRSKYQIKPVTDQTNELTQEAEDRGVTDGILEQSVERNTPEQIAENLDVPIEVVNAVREQYGVPSMENQLDFVSWRQDKLTNYEQQTQKKVSDTPEEIPDTQENEKIDLFNRPADEHIDKIYDIPTGDITLDQATSLTNALENGTGQEIVNELEKIYGDKVEEKLNEIGLTIPYTKQRFEQEVGKLKGDTKKLLGQYEQEAQKWSDETGLPIDQWYADNIQGIDGGKIIGPPGLPVKPKPPKKVSKRVPRIQRTPWIDEKVKTWSLIDGQYSPNTLSDMNYSADRLKDEMTDDYGLVKSLEMAVEDFLEIAGTDPRQLDDQKRFLLGTQTMLLDKLFHDAHEAGHLQEARELQKFLIQERGAIATAMRAGVFDASPESLYSGYMSEMISKRREELEKQGLTEDTLEEEIRKYKITQPEEAVKKFVDKVLKSPPNRRKSKVLNKKADRLLQDGYAQILDILTGKTGRAGAGFPIDLLLEASGKIVQGLAYKFAGQIAYIREEFDRQMDIIKKSTGQVFNNDTLWKKLMTPEMQQDLLDIREESIAQSIAEGLTRKPGEKITDLYDLVAREIRSVFKQDNPNIKDPLAKLSEQIKRREVKERIWRRVKENLQDGAPQELKEVIDEIIATQLPIVNEKSLKAQVKKRIQGKPWEMSADKRNAEARRITESLAEDMDLKGFDIEYLNAKVAKMLADMAPPPERKVNRTPKELSDRIVDALLKEPTPTTPMSEVERAVRRAVRNTKETPESTSLYERLAPIIKDKVAASREVNKHLTKIRKRLIQEAINLEQGSDARERVLQIVDAMPSEGDVNLGDATKRLIRQGLKDMQTSLREIAIDHYTEKTEYKGRLRTKLIKELGLNPEDAAAWEKEFSKAWKEAFEAETKKILKQRYKESKTMLRNKVERLKKMKKAPAVKDELFQTQKALEKLEKKKWTPPIEGMITDLSLGLTDDETLIERFADKWGLPSVTPEVAQKLKKLAQDIKIASTDRQRSKAYQDFLAYLDSLAMSRATKAAKYLQSAYMTFLLSGYTTQQRVLMGTTLGFLADALPTILAVARKDPKVLRMMFKYFAKRDNWISGVEQAVHQLWSGREGIKFSEESPYGYRPMDQLVNTPLVDLKAEWDKGTFGNKSKAAFKTMLKYGVGPFVVATRMLGAIDLFFKGGFLDFYGVMKAYESLITEGRDKTEADFYTEIEKRIGRGNMAEIKAEIQDEIAAMKALGQKVPWGYRASREKELITHAYHENVRKDALNKVEKVMLMAEPEGQVGRIAKGIKSKTQIKRDDKGPTPWTKVFMMTIFPILRAPANFINIGYDYTPFGLISNLKEDSLNPVERDIAIIKGGLGLVVAGILMSLSMEWGEDGWEIPEEWTFRVTSHGTGNWSKNKYIDDDWKPLSAQLKVGETVYNMPYVDVPMGTAMYPIGVMNDALRMNPEEKRSFDFADYLLSSVQFFYQQSFSQSLKDIERLGEFFGEQDLSKQTEESEAQFDVRFGEYLGRKARVFTNPATLKQTYAAYKKINDLPRKKVAGDETFASAFLQTFVQDNPLFENILARDDYDIFGYPIESYFELPYTVVGDGMIGYIDGMYGEMEKKSPAHRLMLSRADLFPAERQYNPPDKIEGKTLTKEQKEDIRFRVAKKYGELVSDYAEKGVSFGQRKKGTFQRIRYDKSLSASEVKDHLATIRRRAISEVKERL